MLIARALAGEPDLLVLDEPTAGVDLEHQEVLAELLTHRLGGRIALLVVLHEVGPLAPLIDRVIRLRDGQVVSADGDLAAHTHEHGSPDHDQEIAADTTGLSEPGLDGTAHPMIELLGYPFMQRALLAALLTGLIAPAIGTYLVQRRLSLLGDGSATSRSPASARRC